MNRDFKQNRIKKFFLFFIIILLVLLACAYYTIERNIKPMISTLSEIKARGIATQAISLAINKKMPRDSFNNLIFVKTDNNGKVTMVQANTMEMNKLASDTSLEIQEQLKNISSRDLSIPISNIFGSQVFANIGPKIKVNIQPTGTVNVDFNTEFEAAGINQTRLKIYLTAKTDIRIIVPLASSKISVLNHIPISETIIVGDVPESYIDVPRDEMANFVPTTDPINK